MSRLATQSRRMAQRLARKGLDRGQEPARRISIFGPGSPASFGRRVGGLNSRFDNCPGPQAALALKSATATIPIVFVAVSDPVGIGLVQSLSRPGGNMTGLATYVPGEFRRKTNRNPPGTGSWRLENCALGQSGQPNAQADISRGGTPHSPEPWRGSADS